MTRLGGARRASLPARAQIEPGTGLSDTFQALLELLSFTLNVLKLLLEFFFVLR